MGEKVSFSVVSTAITAVFPVKCVNFVVDLAKRVDFMRTHARSEMYIYICVCVYLFARSRAHSLLSIHEAIR